jgi:hypothetical protein
MHDQALLAYLLTIAVTLSGYPTLTLDTLPPIEQLAPEALRAAACGDAAIPCDNLVAHYDSRQGRILISDRLDLHDAADNSFLVHEMVHVLQQHQQGEGYMASCEATLAAEREAYWVQNAYLGREGRSERHGNQLAYLVCAPRQPDNPAAVAFELGPRRPSDNDIFAAFMQTLRRPTNSRNAAPFAPDEVRLQPLKLWRAPWLPGEWLGPVAVF